MSRRSTRYWHAFWRDTRVLIRQFRVSLLIFAALLLLGTLSLRFFYVHPETGGGLDWTQSLYATFSLLFLEVVVPFPDAFGLRLLFFLVPLIGLGVVADGVLRFGVALFNRRQRREAWQMAVASTYQDHVVVCGLGRVGYRVVNELIRLGEDVIGIECKAGTRFVEKLQERGITVLVGDARTREILRRAQVPEASAIVIATEDDLTNLDVALDARELNPDIKVVMRMFDARLAEKIRRGFAIHTAFSTSALAAPIFAAAATRAQIDYSFYVGEMMLNVARAHVCEDSELVGRTVIDVEETYDTSIVLHQRGDEVFLHPAPAVQLEAGDRLVFFASLEALARLREASGEPLPVSGKERARKQRSLLDRLFRR